MSIAVDKRSMLRVGIALVAIAAIAGTLTVFLGADAGHASDSLGTAVSPPVSHGSQPNLIAQNIFNGIVFGLLLALASVGLSLIYGTTGLSNFAHGEQVSFGGVMAFFLTTTQNVSLPFLWFNFSLHLPFWLGATLAVVAGGILGWFQDRFLWSKLRKRGVGIMQQMIVSIGLSLLAINLLQLWIGASGQRLVMSIPERYSVGPIDVDNQKLWMIGICTAALFAVVFFLQRTRFGRATRAVSDNPSLAAASGISVARVTRIVWTMSGGLAALAGIMLAFYESNAAFNAGSRLLLLMFAAVTLGGLGHPYGALVGSLVVGVLTELSTVWVPPDLKFATALGILILTLLARPQGILGRPERVG